MSAHKCLICEQMAEPPFAFLLMPKASGSKRTKPPIVICQVCMEGNTVHRSVDQIEQEIQTGTCCHFCFDYFSPPGGTTMRTLDGRRLLRVCHACKEVFIGEKVR